MKSRIAAVIAAMMIGALAVGSVATAHTFDSATNTSARYSNKQDAFKGKISAGRKACKRNRNVTVFKYKKGKDKSVGSDTSSRGGYWTVPQNQANGTFYAVVSERHNKKYGHNHHCRRGRSGDVRV